MYKMINQEPKTFGPSAERVAASFSFVRLLRLATLAAAVLLVSGQFCVVRAQSIVAIVNGEAITNGDIEQRSKLNTLTKRTPLTREQSLQELIDDKVKIKEGKKYGLEIGESDVNESYAGTASHMRTNVDNLNKMLEHGGVRPETFKAKMKADMVWSNLVKGRYGKSFDISDKELQEKLGTGSDAATQVESFEYKVRPIVLVVPRGAPPSTMELRKKEAETLRARVESCDQAVGLFRAMRDSAIRDSVTKTSADLAAPLRELLDKTPIGKLTPPEVTRQGIEMVALCDRQATKIDSPAKRQIKEKIYSERFEAKSKSYLEEARRGAMIEMK
jgi:peptidyl-prolyl cis-trans isomerase SurA